MRPWRLPRLAHTMGAGSFSAPPTMRLSRFCQTAGPWARLACTNLSTSGTGSVKRSARDPAGSATRAEAREPDGRKRACAAIGRGCLVVKVRAQPPPRPRALRAGRIGFGCELTLAPVTREPSSGPRGIRAQRRKRNRARRACVREHTAPARACGNDPSTPTREAVKWFAALQNPEGGSETLKHIPWAEKNVYMCRGYSCVSRALLIKPLTMSFVRSLR